jgi:hypothetical protein
MSASRTPRRRARRAATTLLAAGLAACGSGEGEQAAPPAPAPAAPAPAEPAGGASAAATPAVPADLPRGVVLALAQFVDEGGKSVPGPARLEFLYREGGAWKTAVLEDPESNVFHKALVYDGAAGRRLLSLGGTEAIVKSWAPVAGKLEATTLWKEHFGGKWSRMRDAEVADVYGDGGAAIAVATHDQGVVAVLRPKPGSGDAMAFDAVELHREKDTVVHEIEVGDLDGDGVLEIYATPSEPNRLDGTPQSGKVVRYVPQRGEGRVVVADLGERHAKEILVEDLDGDGRDELYVAVEGTTQADGKTLADPVEIRVYQAGTPPTEGVRIATLPDRLTRFLTAGDVDGDGRKELVAAAFSSGLWLLHPGRPEPSERPSEPQPSDLPVELIDRDSAGFEHAAILTDLDGDGTDELYVASDKHKELRRYVWRDGRAVRETIYRRPDARPIFTWNLMPVPVELIPGSGS